MTFDGLAVADPWIALTAVALATERLRLGAMVTPLARRRPWDVARQVAVLDRLSGGRMVFGAGLGGDSRRELSAFGEERDPRARAALLDEALELVVDLWRGEPVTRDGAAFALDGARGAPDAAAAAAPAGVAGLRVAPPPPARARGALRRRLPGQPQRSRSPATTCARCWRSSPSTAPPDAGAFDVVLVNHERPDAERLAELGDAGATWWLQGFGERPRLADVQDAAAAGPPQ